MKTAILFYTRPVLDKIFCYNTMHNAGSAFDVRRYSVDPDLELPELPDDFPSDASHVIVELSKDLPDGLIRNSDRYCLFVQDVQGGEYETIRVEEL